MGARAVGVVGAAALAAVVPHARHGYAVVAVAVVAAGLAAAVVDRRERRVPNRLVLASLFVVVAAVGVSAAVDGRWREAGLGMVAGVVVLGGPLLTLHVASPGSLGFGDVKLALVLGAGLGAGHPVVAAAGLAGACAVAPIHRAMVGRWRGAEPFAPSLAAGAIVALAVAPWMVRALGFAWFG